MYKYPYGTSVADELGNVTDWMHIITIMAINYFIGITKTTKAGLNIIPYTNLLAGIKPKISLGFSIIGNSLIAISNIIDGVQSGKSALNIVTDTVFDITSIATIAYMGSALGAAIGSVLPGLGTAIGALIGLFSGIIYSAISSTQFIKDLKQGFYQGVNQIINDVGRVIQVVGNAINSFFNWLFSW